MFKSSIRFFLKIAFVFSFFCLISPVSIFASDSEVLKKIKDPSILKSLNQASQFLISKKKYIEALGLLNLLVVIDPNNAEGLYKRSILHGRIGDFEKAVEDYNEAVDIDPKKADIFFKCLMVLRKCKFKS